MSKKLSRFWAVLLSFLLAVVSPLTAAWQRVFHPTPPKADVSAGATDALAATALAFTVLPPPVGPPTLFAGPADIFINGLLVSEASFGFVQESVLSAASFMAGIGYSAEGYMKVTQTVPAVEAMRVRGWAMSAAGEVHILDCTSGLPPLVFWQDGLPVTPSGQLCVVFV